MESRIGKKKEALLREVALPIPSLYTFKATTRPSEDDLPSRRQAIADPIFDILPQDAPLTSPIGFIRAAATGSAADRD